MNTVKSRAFMKLTIVFCILCVMLSFSDYTGAQELSVKGLYRDEGGVLYRLNGESLTASAVFGTAASEITVSEKLTVNGDSYTVVSVDQKAFYENRTVQSVQLPDTVTHVGDMAFFGCSSLERVEANGLTSAGRDAFTGTPFITKDEFSVLGEVLLRYNGSRPLVKDIPSVTYVADAFAYNFNIKTVILPDTVTTVGDGAFGMAKALKSVSLPFSVEKIGNKAFFGCSSLEGVSVTVGVKEIGESAFEGTPFLAQLMRAQGDMIILGDGVLVRYKGDSESVILPAGVKYISDAFAYTSVKTVSLPSGCRLGTAAFKNAEKLYGIEVNGKLSHIGDYAFSGCTALEYISIRGAFEGAVGYGAFKNTSAELTVYLNGKRDGKSVLEEKGVRVLSPLDLVNLP